MAGAAFWRQVGLAALHRRRVGIPVRFGPCHGRRQGEDTSAGVARQGRDCSGRDGRQGERDRAGAQGVVFRMAEVAVRRQMIQEILTLAARLRALPSPA